MGDNGFSVTDALALSNNNDGMFGGGGNGAWWIIILLLFAGGFNGFGGNNRGTPATTQDVSDAFNFNGIDNSIRGIQNGLCDGFYAQNNATHEVLAALQNCCCQTQMTMTNGFHDVSQGICNLGYQTQAGFTDIGNRMAACCCDLARGQDALKFEMANNTTAILTANEKNTDRIISYLTQSELDRTRAELQSTQFQLSQYAQTNNIVSQLMPVAKPAYITCSPYASAFGFCGSPRGLE